jgi:hypothetical protein
MMQAEIQNLTAAVIGLGIALAIGLTAVIKWLPDYIKRRADLSIKKEDAALEDKREENKQEREQWELLRTSVQTGVQSAQNTLQLASQMAAMNQHMERQLNIMAGMSAAVDDTLKISKSLVDNKKADATAFDGLKDEITKSFAAITSLLASLPSSEQLTHLITIMEKQINKEIAKQEKLATDEKPVITSTVTVTSITEDKPQDKVA